MVRVLVFVIISWVFLSLRVSPSTSIRYHDTGNHIYKYGAHHDITTNPPIVPSRPCYLNCSGGVACVSSCPVVVAIIVSSCVSCYPSRRASRILPVPVPSRPSSRPSSPWQAGGGIVAAFYRNAPFSEAHSSLPTNTKRNTARTMAFLSSSLARPPPAGSSLICGPQTNPPPPGRRDEQAVMMIAWLA